MQFEAALLAQAKGLGVSLAGVSSIARLQHAPSYQASGQAVCPPEAKSVLVLALAHPENQPELDWWGVDKGTPGNQRLYQISGQLTAWLVEAYQIQAWPLPYHLEKGGIFLKDAAVLAGLGIIGDNNLLLTPEFGPRVRLRALFFNAAVAPLAPEMFAPCANCSQPCRLACPQQAFVAGVYDRTRCARQMQTDEAHAVVVNTSLQDDPARTRVKYCRACELSCPVGQK